mgnify:CR=1 FL=1
MSEITRLMVMAAASVIENSRNNRSTKPPINKIDRKITTKARFIANKVKPTSDAPCRAACKGVKPLSI